MQHLNVGDSVRKETTVYEMIRGNSGRNIFLCTLFVKIIKIDIDFTVLSAIICFRESVILNRNNNEFANTIIQ
jgi:hypothetical protein